MAKVVMIGASEDDDGLTATVARALEGVGVAVERPPRPRAAGVRLDPAFVQELCTARLLAAGVVVCVESGNTDSSFWVQAELRVARQLGVPIVVVRAEDVPGGRPSPRISENLRYARQEAAAEATRRWHAEMAEAESEGECGPITPFLMRDAMDNLPHRRLQREVAVSPDLSAEVEAMRPWSQALSSTLDRVRRGELTAMDGANGVLAQLDRVVGGRFAQEARSRRQNMTDVEFLKYCRAVLDGGADPF